MKFSDIKYRNMCLPYVILYGGKGTEREVSILSARQIIGCAERIGRPFLAVEIGKDGVWRLAKNSPKTEIPPFETVHPLSFDGAPALLTESQGLIHILGVIPVLHGKGGEDGAVEGLFECLGIPYSGCGILSSAVAYDKCFSKIIAEYIGIPVVPFVTFDLSSSCNFKSFFKDVSAVKEAAEGSFGYPMFVKPSREGSSFGAQIAKDEKELLSSIDKALNYCQRVLIEKYVPLSMELECAYFSADGRRVITSPGTVKYLGEFYDEKRKYRDAETRVYPVAEVSDEVRRTVIEYTEKIVSALEVSEISRVDYFLSEDGKIYFNEINTFPGMTEKSLYPLMLASFGIDLDTVLVSLISSLGKKL